MALPVDGTASSFLANSTSPLSKRRKFIPPAFGPIIPCSDNSMFENHTFSSPILPQLSSQAPTPEEIEASLLQVGMRVRKSVNDGYRNSPQKKFTPRPFAGNMHRLSPETQRALMAGSGSETQQCEEFSAGGLHKVGNMAMQPLATATFCGINLAMMPGWQSEDYTSIEEQHLWTYTTSSKRSYEVDSDSDESQDWAPRTPALIPEFGAAMPMDYFNINVDSMSEVSPFTQPGEMMNHRGRKMAKPRSRVRATQMHGVQDYAMPPVTASNPFAAVQMMPMQDQAISFGFGHQVDVSCGVEAQAMDFGEAPFLQRREDTEMDCS
jgi:hypothetical protein